MPALYQQLQQTTIRNEKKTKTKTTTTTIVLTLTWHCVVRLFGLFSRTIVRLQSKDTVDGESQMIARRCRSFMCWKWVRRAIAPDRIVFGRNRWQISHGSLELKSSKSEMKLCVQDYSFCCKSRIVIGWHFKRYIRKWSPPSMIYFKLPLAASNQLSTEGAGKSGQSVSSNGCPLFSRNNSEAEISS